MYKKYIKIGLVAALASCFSVNAATQVVTVTASVDSSLTVIDTSGSWDAPIAMAVNSAGDGLQTKNINLNMVSNNYKDVLVTLQSFPSLTDSVNGTSIPMTFKIADTALAQNTPVTIDKDALYNTTEGAITSAKDITLSIESASTTALASGQYRGSFTFDFSIAP